MSGLNWGLLPSLGGFLSLRDLVNLSLVDRVWRHLLDHPSMERILRESLQREWWVTCSVEQMRAGFQSVRKKIDFSLRFPYRLTKFTQNFSDPAIRSCYLGDGHWVSVDWDGQMKFWQKTKLSSSFCIGITSPRKESASVCMIGSKRCVVVTKQNTYLVNMASRKILQMPITHPNYSVFRWAENQVVFASGVEKKNTLHLCSIGDTRCKYEEDAIRANFKVHQVIPCSEELGIIGTPKCVCTWRLGKNGCCTDLETSTTETFWKILPLNHEKIVLQNGIEAVVKVWNIEQSKKERSYVYGSQLQMTKLPNASFLLYAHNEKHALFVDPLMPKPVHAFMSPQKGFTGAVWTGNGPYVVTSYDKNMHFWDMRRHQIIQSMVLSQPMCIVDKMASGDFFLQDPFNRFVALLTPPCTSKNPQDKTI